MGAVAAMQIGELAAQAGVSVQTLRYYERRGLVWAARKPGSRYRQYGTDTVRTIRFIRRAQALGFTLDEIHALLGLWAESSKSCSAAERQASAKLGSIEAKIGDLVAMRDALTQYVAACRSRKSLHECPLLAGLGEPEDGHDS